jgi:hypothetical protein
MHHTRPCLNRFTPLALLACVAGGIQAKEYHVYYLGGQSNMDGFGLVSELNEDQRRAVDGCMIYHGAPQNDGSSPEGVGSWATLQPGHGFVFGVGQEANRLGDRFGPELTFGRAMQERFPDRNIAIIKYSRGGSSIELNDRIPCWDPHDEREKDGNIGANQYDYALQTIDNAMRIRDIDGDGESDTLIPAGIVWMQGESDGVWKEAADAYEENLGELMELFRAAMRRDGLPVVIGRISDSHQRDGDQPVWIFGDAIRAAQARFCEADPDAALVTSTDEYGYSDPYHYDTSGYLDLGVRFAEAMHTLETRGSDD